MAKINEGDKKNIKTLHLSMCFGILMITLVIYYLISTNPSETIYSFNTMFFRISAVILLLCLLAGSKLYQININHASNKKFDSYEAAHSNFRATNILRWAFLECGTVMSIILAYLDNNLLGLILGAIGLLFLYISKPNVEHFNYYKF